MATIDVRNMDEGEVECIRFAEDRGHVGNDGDCPLASLLTLEDYYIVIEDLEDTLVIKDKAHALNLIKALNKAIELGWLA